MGHFALVPNKLMYVEKVFFCYSKTKKALARTKCFFPPLLTVKDGKYFKTMLQAFCVFFMKSMLNLNHVLRKFRFLKWGFGFLKYFKTMLQACCVFIMKIMLNLNHVLRKFGFLKWGFGFLKWGLDGVCFPTCRLVLLV